MTGTKVYTARYKNIKGTVSINYDSPEKPLCEFKSSYFDDDDKIVEYEDLVLISEIKQSKNI